ncbi:MAG: pilus assembly protein [Rhodobacteraceae bacterium]|nr:pilus assembly protein [Paracoccaceae bacterium]
MGNALTSLRRWFSGRACDEEGSATIPFAIMMPFFLILVMSSLEMGMMLIRHVLLERSLDLAVRNLRLGTWVNPTHDQLKKVICNNAWLIPNCSNVLLVELRPVSKVTWQPLSAGPVCVDRAKAINLPPPFQPGAGDEMMLIRVCAKFDPIYPMTGLGFHLPKDNTGAYALISSTAFVNEPDPDGN